MSSSLLTTDYSHITSPPALLGVECEAQQALPEMVEPTEQPPYTGGLAEDLTVVRHPLVLTLPVYRDAGWKAAVDTTMLRRGVAERLYRAAEALPAPFGLAVFDAHRSLALQKEIYEVAYLDPTLPAGFVTPPSEDPATPPPHLTGGTVDVTLTWNGTPLELGTAFDDFTPRAHADALEGEPGVERELRRLLYWTMREEGFRVIACEWWHFECGTRRWAALTGERPLYGAVHTIPRQRQES